MTRTGVSALAILLAFAASVSAQAASIGKGKKLIEFGWDSPPIERLWKEAPKLDRNTPFDGLVTSGAYYSEGKRKDFAWNWFGSEKIPQYWADVWIGQSKRARFGAMQDNFIRMNTMPGADWFEDFGAIEHNARLLAEVAKRGGYKGILLDVEEYQRTASEVAIFSYPYQKYRESRSYIDYAAQVRLRGRQIGAAIGEAFPKAVILMTHGNSWPYDLMKGQEQNPDEVMYGLLPAFIDGLLDSLPQTVKILDGYEASYGYRDVFEFAKARELIGKSAEFSSDPERYKRRMGVGFGLCPDYPSPSGSWDPADYREAYFTPDEFEYAVFSALKETDQYVWIYSQRPNWYTGENVPEAYAHALADSRKDHPLKRGRRRSLVNEPARKMYVSSKTTPGTDDQSVFGDLWRKCREVAPVPKVWKFQLDPDDIGMEQGWFGPAHPVAGWKDIEIGEWWEPQGYRYDGVAWYLAEISVPRRPEGHRLWLVFGAADDNALVYVNGKEAGEHYEIGRKERNDRFFIEITETVKTGAVNAVAVRVLDLHLLGGLWKSVKLVELREPGIGKQQ